MKRKLLDGTEVPEYDVAVTLQVYTRCPAKYKLIDMETGQEYIGQLPTDYLPNWKKINDA